MSHLFNGCFAVLNIATSSCTIQSRGVIYKTNTTFIRTIFFQQFFQATARIVPTVKFPPSPVSDSATKKPLLLSSFQIARADETKKKHFARLSLSKHT